MEALRNFKEFPLKNFHCLSGGKNIVSKPNLLSARVLEILGNSLKF